MLSQAVLITQTYRHPPHFDSHLPLPPVGKNSTLACSPSPRYQTRSYCLWPKPKKLKVKIKKNSTGGAPGRGQAEAALRRIPVAAGAKPPKEKLNPKRLVARNGGEDTAAGAGGGSNDGRSGGQVLPKIRITFNAVGGPKIVAPPVGGKKRGRAPQDKADTAAAENHDAPLKPTKNSGKSSPLNSTPPTQPAHFLPMSDSGGAGYTASGKRKGRPPGGEKKRQQEQIAGGVGGGSREERSGAGVLVLPPRRGGASTVGTRHSRTPSPFPSVVIKPPEPEPVLSLEESRRRTCIKLVRWCSGCGLIVPARSLGSNRVSPNVTGVAK